MQINTIKGSLLTEECIKRCISSAKAAFMPKGDHLSLLLVRFESGRVVRGTLNLGCSEHDDRFKIMFETGLQLRARHGEIREALYVAESWMTDSNTPDCDKVRPSQHPARKETILLVGRNYDKTTSAIAFQPFSRDQDENPIWESPTISISQEQDELTFEGILDELFNGASDVILSELEA